VSNCDKASICPDRSRAAVCAASPTTTIEMSRSGFQPWVAARARAMMTPADAIEVTPMRLPLRSAKRLIGLSAGTTIP